MTRLYMTTIEEANKLPAEYCRKFFPRRLERAERFRFREDYLRCIGAGALLREVLGVREEELVTEPGGKPRIREESLRAAGKEFSLSHSGDYVLLAVSGSPVGTDIGLLSERHLGIAGRVFREEELRWMEELPEERTARFYQLWTMKESVMKCFGEGLSMAPESFSVLELLLKNRAEVKGQYLSAAGTNVPGCRISVCVQGAELGNGKMPELNMLSFRRPAGVQIGLTDRQT